MCILISSFQRHRGVCIHAVWNATWQKSNWHVDILYFSLISLSYLSTEWRSESSLIAVMAVQTGIQVGSSPSNSVWCNLLGQLENLVLQVGNQGLREFHEVIWFVNVIKIRLAYTKLAANFCHFHWSCRHFRPKLFSKCNCTSVPNFKSQNAVALNLILGT